MKLAATLIFLAGIVCLGEEPYYQRISNIHESGARALKENLIKAGDSTIPLFFKGKKYPGTWAFWCIGKGEKPSDFEMIPMKAQITGGKKPLFRTAQLTCFSDMNFAWLRNNGEGSGIAFSFTNPSKKELDLELDGSLRLYYDSPSGCRIFVYTQTPDGQIQEIADSAKPDSIIPVTRSKKTVYYLRLSSDVKLAPGARLYFAFLDLDIGKLTGKKTRTVFCLNEGIRKPQFIPNFILRSPIRD